MTTHVFPGLGCVPLINYLAALGVAKGISEQADPAARFGWRDGVFHMDTEVEDVAEFFVQDFVPTPVFSPWNGGSGFGAKDKTPLEYIQILESSTAHRLAPYRNTLAVIRSLLIAKSEKAWTKERFVQELRNRLPDDALPWTDASVVLTAKKTEYPPILGTGGNDGRLDFSTNVHQRLKDVLPELGAEPERSWAWMQDLLWGRSTEKLLAASVGQGDPVGAGTPGSSAFGSADAMVNPWGFILMVEGAMLFAASVAKRLGEQNSRVAIPFTVSSSPDGPIPGSAQEEGRGELWAPLLESVTLTELRQVFEEARVSWDGGTASSAVSMYAAVRSFGVNRGISAFQRFGFLKRNGLAFVAVPLDHVKVEARPEVVMAREPLRRARTFHKASGVASKTAARRFDASVTAFVRDPEWWNGIAMLRAQTELELTALRSRKNREELGHPSKLVPANAVIPVCQELFLKSPEARIAAGIASATFLPPTASQQGGGSGGQPIRRLLVGADPKNPKDPIDPEVMVPGLGVRPTVDVLADLVVWLAQHPGEDTHLARGWLPFLSHRYLVPWTDIHAWVGGLLDDDLVTHHLLAFLAVDWSRRKDVDTVASAGECLFLDPTLAILQALASRSVRVRGTASDATGVAVGLEPSWPLQLRADRVADVHRAASGVINRGTIRLPWAEETDIQVHTHSTRMSQPGLGPRILAALAAPSKPWALRRSAPEVENTESYETTDLYEGALQ